MEFVKNLILQPHLNFFVYVVQDGLRDIFLQFGDDLRLQGHIVMFQMTISLCQRIVVIHTFIKLKSNCNTTVAAVSAWNIIALWDTICDLWLLFLSNEGALVTQINDLPFWKTTYIYKDLTELHMRNICVRDAPAGTKLRTC